MKAQPTGQPTRCARAGIAGAQPAGPALALGALVAATPATALASGGFEFNVHGFFIINTIVLLAVLIKVGRKPLRGALEARRDAVKKELDEAQRLHAEAAARLTEYEQKLAELEAERKRILDGFRAAGEREHAALMADATATAERLVAEAERRIAQEGKRLLAAVEREAIDKAIALAQARIEGQLDDAAHAALVEQSIGAIDGLMAARGSRAA